MSTTLKLSTTLKAIADQATATDDTATALLKIIREAEVKTAAQFAALAAEAYKANNWHAGKGRPMKDSTSTPVPRTVRTYVWELRSAFKAKLNVGEFPSFYEMRKALAERRARMTKRHVSRLPELVGVQVSSEARLNGALFHDLAVVYMRMKARERRIVAKGLQRIVSRYGRELPAASTEPAHVH
jgi:hypothetical protein